jgi:hypothetical protein
MTTDIHSCSLYCERPGCIRAQRDELRDAVAAQAQPAHPEPVVWQVIEYDPDNEIKKRWVECTEWEAKNVYKSDHVRALYTDCARQVPNGESPQGRSFTTAEDKPDLAHPEPVACVSGYSCAKCGCIELIPDDTSPPSPPQWWKLVPVEPKP